MSPVKTPKSPKTGDYNDEFVTKTVQLRGTKYVIRELTVAQYDDIVKMASSENDQGETLIDNTLLRKLMTLESIAEPKLESLDKLPMRLSTKLSAVAQEINYGAEPEEEKEDKPDIEVGDDEEGEA